MIIVDRKHTICADAGHAAWTETYDNPGLYDWLLRQQRSTRKTVEK